MTPTQIVNSFKQAMATSLDTSLFCREDMNNLFNSLGWDTTLEGNTCLGVAFIEKIYVLKVVKDFDPFVKYAKAIRSRKIRSKHYLKIYKVEQYVEDVYIIVSEYCPTECNWREADSINRWGHKGLVSRYVLNAFDRILDNVRGCRDVHAGNIRKRSDNTLVFIDPLC